MKRMSHKIQRSNHFTANMNTLTLVLAGVAIVMLLVSNVDGKFFVSIYLTLPMTARLFITSLINILLRIYLFSIWGFNVMLTSVKPICNKHSW